MAMPVTANEPYVYAYSWKDLSVKVAKIPAGTLLSVVLDIEGAYEIVPLPAGTYDAYPTSSARWFIEKTKVTKVTIQPPPIPEPEPELPSGAITAEQALAFIAVARYILGG